MITIKKVKNNKKVVKPLNMKKYRVPKRCRDGYREVDELLDYIWKDGIQRDICIKYGKKGEADWLNEQIVGYNKRLDVLEKEGFVVERDIYIGRKSGIEDVSNRFVSLK